MSASKNRFPYRLYLVTDDRACLGRDVVRVTEHAVKGGVDVVQLREKHLTAAAFLDRALRMKEMLTRYDVPLIINDNLWVTRKCGAAGIHVGNSDVSPMEVRASWKDAGIIGYSVEAEAQVSSVSAGQSDYLGVSPVFATPTKTDTIVEWGLEGLGRLRQLTHKPLVAIGGIKMENAGAVMTAGADCLAVVSAICGADDPARAAEAFRVAIEKALRK